MSRPSPVESATVFDVGTVKRGSDGNLWSVVEVHMKKSGTTVQRWQRVTTVKKSSRALDLTPADVQQYFIIYGYDMPFRVETARTSARVFRRNDKPYLDRYEEKLNYDVPVAQFSGVKKIFIGTDDANHYDPRSTLGNTILLYMGKRKAGHEYVYIGPSIFSFYTPDNDVIADYCSPLTFAGKPLPVAIGSINYYFPERRVYVPAAKHSRTPCMMKRPKEKDAVTFPVKMIQEKLPCRKSPSKMDSTHVRSHYFTHDNGGRPFMVRLTKNTASVYRLNDIAQEEGTAEKEDYDTLVRQFTDVERIFIGKDPDNRPEYADGNTILLYLGLGKEGHKYVYIGEHVSSFVTPKNDMIVAYCSPMSSSAVPHAVAVGQLHYYFPSSRAFLPRQMFKLELPCHEVNYYAIPKKSRAPTDLPRFKLIQGRLWGAPEYTPE